jgi:pSer/pThr/pTyr-binding forkhead associated (FHA) protein
LANSDNPYTAEIPIIRLEVKHNGEREIATLPSSGAWTIGRDPAIAHYTIDSKGVSRVHAEWICDEAGQVQVRDLGSRNGSYLNGELLVPFKPQPFGADDVLAIVQTEFRLHSKNSQ